jgi:sensor c-di-GMP phosphodiesterase-like protein
MLATEANDICNKQNKKTISATHIIESLKKLGYESYIEKAEEVLEEHKVEQEKTSKQSKKFNSSGLTQEELLKEQQRLFAQARSNHQIVQSPSSMISPISPGHSQNIFDLKPGTSPTPFVFSSYTPPKVSLGEEEEQEEEEEEEEE